MGHKKQQGFTLIELVIVIIILGILAAIAAPKFLNLRSSAVSASVQGVEAALSSAMTLAITRIEIDNAESSVEYLDQTISLTAGMPDASAGSLRALLEIDVPASWTRNWETVACDEPEFCILGNMFVGKSGYVEVPNFPLSSNGGLDRVSYIWPNGYTLNSNGCYAFYINEASKEIYNTGSITDGC